MLSLKALLTSRNHRDLAILARLHGLPFTRRIPKAQSLKRLHEHIKTRKTVLRAYHRLNPRAKEALTILKASGCSLPYPIFIRRYGEIAPFRPWRGDEAPDWGRFASVTDTLWRLGMISVLDGNPRRVVLLDDLRNLLPSPSLPIPTQPHADLPMMGHHALLHDLTEWLAVACGNPTRLKKGRWLPIALLRRINRGCIWQDDLSDIWGETRTIHLKWLHYLADVAGFITHTERGIMLTVRGWMWLELPNQTRWEWLLDAMLDDWRAELPLWARYHLPKITFSAWDALYRHVVALDVGGYRRDDVTAGLYPYLAIHPAFYPLDEVVEFTIPNAYWDVLAWLGIIDVDGGNIIIPAPIDPPITPATIRYMDNALIITRPMNPAPLAWVKWCAVALPDEDDLRLDARAIREAIGSGETIPHIAQTVATLIGGRLPLWIYEQLETWGRQAHQQTIQTAHLLTVADEARLVAWRGDWRVSKFIHAVISPHHAIIQTDDMTKFAQKLGRRGHPLMQLDDHPPTPPMQTDDYAWLAMRVYQGLSAFMTPPIKIPNAMRHAVAGRVHHGRLTELESVARGILDRLSATIRGYPSGSPVAPEGDADAIRQTVMQMMQTRGAVKIVYFSPARGERTTRTIEPTLIFERDGAEYIEAWCRMDEDMRLFRMDRILAVLGTENMRTGHPF